MQPEHRKTPWQALMAAPCISPIFATPYVGTECIQMDWLHVVDVGIALQFLGSLMKYFCSKFAGTFDEQVRDMFRCILEFHDVQSVEYRLDHLKPSMIKDTKKFPSLEQKLGNRDAWCFGLCRWLMPLGMLATRWNRPCISVPGISTNAMSN